jgi:hypothetical protein
MAAPDKRSTGFLISVIALLGLLILSIVGIAQDWMAVSAT